MTSKITSIENYHPSETNLYEGNGEIVMPVVGKDTVRLKPSGYGAVELAIGSAWVVLDPQQVVTLRFALGKALERLGVENVG